MRDQQQSRSSDASSTGAASSPQLMEAAHIGAAMLQALGGLGHPLAHLPLAGLTGVIDGLAALAQSDDIRQHGGLPTEGGTEAGSTEASSTQGPAADAWAAEASSTEASSTQGSGAEAGTVEASSPQVSSAEASSTGATGASSLQALNSRASDAQAASTEASSLQASNSRTSDAQAASTEASNLQASTSRASDAQAASTEASSLQASNSLPSDAQASSTEASSLQVPSPAVASIETSSTELSAASTTAEVSAAPAVGGEGAATSTVWSAIVRRNFATWAGDDGYLSDDELDELMGDPALTGEDAAALAVIHHYNSDLEELSNDEIGDENDGLTLADLAAYERSVAAGGPGDMDWTNDAYRQRLTRTSGQLFAQGGGLVDPGAVRQGHLGDCYFLAALVGKAARDEEYVDEIITDHGDGTYTVDFPGRGEVTIDAPTDAEIAQYSTSGADGLWLAVLEKAYGRVRSDADDADPYDEIGDGDRLSEGIATVTGRGTDTDLLAVTRLSTTRRKLTEAFEGKRVVTASVQSDNHLQLPTGHAYTVLEFDGSDLTIRNPWGRGGGTGDPDNDGEFILSLEEFDDVFFEVCYEEAE